MRALIRLALALTLSAAAAVAHAGRVRCETMLNKNHNGWIRNLDKGINAQLVLS